MWIPASASVSYWRRLYDDSYFIQQFDFRGGSVQITSHPLLGGHCCGLLGISLAPSFSQPHNGSFCQGISFMALSHCPFPNWVIHSLMVSSPIPGTLMESTPSLPRRFHLFHLPSMIHASILGYSLLPSFSRSVDCNLVILCFTCLRN